jgi:cyclic 2,3-diphosphoglycerate synthetase
VLVGGTEKLRGGEEYGVPLSAGLEEAIAEHRPELVLDLSDEPVLDPPARFRLASRVLAHGLAYAGADFRFEAPPLAPFGLPSLGVGGTGKRVGKTAVTGHAARLLSRDRRVVVVAMGRGGPREPEVVSVPPTIDGLLELSRAGRHAASDHLETAALAGVETVGCRRCGGGLAGGVWVSNVPEGARLAVELEPDLVVFDGSGAALPPIRTGRRVVVVGAHQDPAVAAGYLNGYRLLTADLVVLTMAEADSGWQRTSHEIAAVAPGVPVVPVVLRPEPAETVAGRRVAYFGTAARSEIAAHLRDVHGAEVTHLSGNLADRAALRAELDEVDADVWLVELKAAAVDVVAEEGLERGVAVIPVRNDVVAVEGDLDSELLRLAEEAAGAAEVAA